MDITAINIKMINKPKKLKAPNQNPDCKKCGKPFKRYNTIQKYCVDCAISMQQDKLLIKGTPYYEATKKEVKIGDNRTELQNSINKLSRMIDEKFELNTCIDCGKYIDKEKHQIDACHYISRKKNSTLRFHLLNLHSGHNHCNTMNESHETAYRKGLEKRYGKEVLQEIEELGVLYQEIHLSATEISEKLKLVRKLIRTFNTYQFETSLIARKKMNNLIGIYE